MWFGVGASDFLSAGRTPRAGAAASAWCARVGGFRLRVPLPSLALSLALLVAGAALPVLAQTSGGDGGDGIGGDGGAGGTSSATGTGGSGGAGSFHVGGGGGGGSDPLLCQPRSLRLTAGTISARTRRRALSRPASQFPIASPWRI